MLFEFSFHLHILLGISGRYCTEWVYTRKQDIQVHKIQLKLIQLWFRLSPKIECTESIHPFYTD